MASFEGRNTNKRTGKIHARSPVKQNQIFFFFSDSCDKKRLIAASWLVKISDPQFIEPTNLDSSKAIVPS